LTLSLENKEGRIKNREGRIKTRKRRGVKKGVAVSRKRWRQENVKRAAICGWG